MVAAFFEIFFLGHWDSETNHGLTFGYWGGYNNVGRSLARMPGVKIVRCGYNADAVLGEIDFDIITTNGVCLRLWFEEKDPIRRMKGNELRIALADKLARESANH
jgi:hypothetical protein